MNFEDHRTFKGEVGTEIHYDARLNLRLDFEGRAPDSPLIAELLGAERPPRPSEAREPRVSP